jgi:hypothetical protein
VKQKNQQLLMKVKLQLLPNRANQGVLMLRRLRFSGAVTTTMDLKEFQSKRRNRELLFQKSSEVLFRVDIQELSSGEIQEKEEKEENEEEKAKVVLISNLVF